MDKVLAEAERYLHQGDYQFAVSVIREAMPTENREWQLERRRFLAWATLAQGETREAYELFWSCAQHAGARAGILLLTVLAGQVETAVENWSRYCEKQKTPPVELPDARWHSPSVVRPALRILQDYPFLPDSRELGAASVYQALLHQTLGDLPSSFQTLGQVSHYFTPARLLRDQWMDGLLCLPLPKTGKQEAPPNSASRTAGHARTLADVDVGEVVARAAHILLYPDIEVLEKQCQQALASRRHQDALEALRRILFLDPQHTPSLEKRWRLFLLLQDPEQAKQDMYYLMDVYEKQKKIVACKAVAEEAVTLFPHDERALLKMCFLQARLGAPTQLARYGRKLLALCHSQGLTDRAGSYRRWLLRQQLSLDDRADFEAS